MPLESTQDKLDLEKLRYRAKRFVEIFGPVGGVGAVVQDLIAALDRMEREAMQKEASCSTT